MLRDTFAVESLESGTLTLKQEIELLGHRSTRTTEDRYLSWSEKRQSYPH